MIAWEQRPVEIANLLNPAYCAVLLADAVGGYRSRNNDKMPIAFVFLILPLVLHKQTREALPRTTRTDLHVWLQRNPEIRFEAGRRFAGLVPYTKESLLFGVKYELFEVDDSGALQASRNVGQQSVVGSQDTEAAVIRERARFLGRWFAKTGDPVNAYTMWGVRP